MSENQLKKVIDVLESIDDKLDIVVGNTNLIYQEVSSISGNVGMNDSELSSIQSNTSEIRDVLNVVREIKEHMEEGY